MNGVNGHKNGGVNYHQWKVGLLNSSMKYLTAETFGFKINASGTALKKKQTWTLEQDLTEEVVYIKSHLNRYMSADKYGNVTCEAEEKDEDPSQKFAIEYAKDGSGKWAIRNVMHGNYLSGDDDNVKCFSKNISDKELWVGQLSIHPQVNLHNVNRKRYARLCDDELQVTAVIPWGQESLIILHFEDGKYALKTCDNRFLHRDGHLVDTLEDDAKFTLEIRSGANSGLAFRDSAGTYLTAVGATAVMKGRNKSVGKDELFTLEDTKPQVVIQAYSGKKVSIKQGQDVSANQEEEEDETEIFQMEYDEHTELWAFRTCSNKYWSLESSGGIMNVGKEICKNTLFNVEWQGDGTVTIKACNNCYIFNKPTGCLFALSETATEKERFKIKMVNRPKIILRSDFGFVGIKSESKPEYICNKTGYENICLEPQENGFYGFKGPNGKYWGLNAESFVMAEQEKPVNFLLEFRKQSQISIKAPNGKYLKGEQNGLFRARGDEIEAGSLWEY
ncbi:hypothetical protein LOTGIDRAFT_108036 [Lottia gigantea]|uniref:Fascin n=1 Tax=Lottia gigantea TaxID=225164 RepID=V3ZP01_LOTGI|nr:hypothetical protein LOTGIDRAFT_108036 [Lottia gigantea]ESO84220.1 hypothetical protein LOTGIDRAFT_108036 [Lottia gigantea]